MAADIHEANDYACATKSVNSSQELLLSPHLLALCEFGFIERNVKETIDPAIYGDVLAGRRDVYAFGEFDRARLARFVVLLPPATLGARYGHVACYPLLMSCDSNIYATFFIL